MKVRVLKGRSVKHDGRYWHEGEEIEVPENVGADLLARDGYVKAVVEPKPKPATADPPSTPKRERGGKGKSDGAKTK